MTGPALPKLVCAQDPWARCRPVGYDSSGRVGARDSAFPTSFQGTGRRPEWSRLQCPRPRPHASLPPAPLQRQEPRVPAGQRRAQRGQERSARPGPVVRGGATARRVSTGCSFYGLVKSGCSKTKGQQRRNRKTANEHFLKARQAQ